jgi:membrane-associated protein
MFENISAFLTQIQQWLDPRALATSGYLVITLVVCAETGIAMGVIMPGESLVLVAGMLAATGTLELSILIPCLFVAAVVGDAMGFAIGSRLGPRIFTRTRSIFFRPEYLIRANRFYEKYGGKTIVLARFVPVVRTFAPIVAGAARMKYRQFLIFNLVGAFLWVMSMLLMGYFLGKAIPELESKLGLVILLVILVSLVIPAFDLVRLHVGKWRSRNESPARPAIVELPPAGEASGDARESPLSP